MLDIGWTELFVIGIILIVVVGPKDLPPMLRAFGKMTSNLRKMAGDFRSQFDEALRESDMDEVRKTIADVQKLNPSNALRDAVNPLRQMGNEIRSDLEKSTRVKKPDVEARKVVEGVIPADQPAVNVPQPAMSLPAAPPVFYEPPTTDAKGDSTAPPKAPRKPAKPKPVAGSDAQAAVEGRKPNRPRATVSSAEATSSETPTPRKRTAKKADTPKDEA
ncbi:MAG: Sec-independent protein translocase protein TatB [Pseudorhizobium sp.]